MTKFFQDNQPPNVWDPIKNKVVVRFQNKVFETDDPSLAELLAEAGYRYHGLLPEKASVSKPAVEKPALKKQAEPRMVRKKK